MLSAEHALAEADAMLALGRLEGGLAMAAPATLRLLALRLLRDMLITALRQEGHGFTDQRFHAWFAGVATLSDEPARTARPPRALCEAILTELTHSSWNALAQAATRFQAALLAPSDDTGNRLAAETAYQDAGAVIAAAHDLLSRLAPSSHPLAASAQLHAAAGDHVLFAPSERAVEPMAIWPDAVAGKRLTVERLALPCPRWALELLWGAQWRKSGLLSHALPFPGLIRLDVLRANTATDFAMLEESPAILATTLRDAAQTLSASLSEADRLAHRLAECQIGQRRSSRAPALLELLAGFGPLRSGQLEGLLGVSRLGLRTMLGTLDTAGLLTRTTLSGVHLYATDLSARGAYEAQDDLASSTFSTSALGEYDAAMAKIDALLTKSGVTADDSDREA
ncbi:MAG: hypothetical protein B7Y36_10275 [Novosphingobium sp. 28-62-57]|uniref:hypothetical protein n=1 Tax=unclassified Novosphingobium TaxID=2644732 RepID=UPI000BD23801|nr:MULTISPECIES: hypothetical protein [unclassified Novosphingobium]OYW51292.1 MAG: hypothetical protein B7Z34_00305 [Novosphingobium sp. 12-62-10]OYZ10569.1 MAG: hypothetical protein B7Y36_10275 [Novosphingobium sp. 28-62-57]OZA40301.1 MAG: hypothetical protein B7X92_01805 [Novosphingobium sp. 17-62-9]HQS68043.1 hypothetical protein [Novosphingobium sp.]